MKVGLKLGLALLSGLTSLAGGNKSVVLIWDKSPDDISLPDNASNAVAVVGYSVYWGTTSGIPSRYLNVGAALNTNFTRWPGCAECLTNCCALVTNLDYLLYFFTVTASTTNGYESVPSREIALQITPQSPSLQTVNVNTNQ